MSLLPLNEKPQEFRTKTSHWAFYWRAGLVKVYALKPSDDGTSLVIGKQIQGYSREEMRKRPDILTAFARMLGEWVQQ